MKTLNRISDIWNLSDFPSEEREAEHLPTFGEIREKLTALGLKSAPATRNTFEAEHPEYSDGTPGFIHTLPADQWMQGWARRILEGDLTAQHAESINKLQGFYQNLRAAYENTSRFMPESPVLAILERWAKLNIVQPWTDLASQIIELPRYSTD